MALPATANFTGANGTAVSSLADWDKIAAAGNMQIQSNGVSPNDATESSAYWVSDTFNNDQYSQVVVQAITGGAREVGAACRMSAAAESYYGVYHSASDGFCFKVIAGVFTQFGATLAGAAATNILRIEASGTTITSKKNGTVTRTTTDSALASGVGGICGFDNATTTRLDDWEGGNLAGAAASMALPPPARAYQHLLVR